ncbi:hypothetical protein L2W58_01015 [Dethiosulfovibrio sp. F2B]|uniref:hypothetical protein n=1 Tax=Dethiosulfovibrio faecalis TaxID=2720018 RepID=UPI001F26BE87|nr:hypothetical protein [Dethiosulfovibrio faecalis]MCF4150386.1 hypothetical protein [Dethiosulfovibrio faecalis]
MRRSGFSLVLVLIVLTVGSAFVFASLYIVENFHRSSSRSIRRMEMYSMAVSEIEHMKAWLTLELEDKPFPLMKYHGGYFSSWDEDPDDGVSFDVLLARVDDFPMIRDGSTGNLTSKTAVYDLVYRDSGLAYIAGLPPRRSGELHVASEGESEKEENYGGNVEGLSVYLVRTTVRDDQGFHITLEQTVEKSQN